MTSESPTTNFLRCSTSLGLTHALQHPDQLSHAVVVTFLGSITYFLQVDCFACFLFFANHCQVGKAFHSGITYLLGQGVIGLVDLSFETLVNKPFSD